MKVAIEYSGYLRFIKDTYPSLNKMFTSNETVEFYIFFHTWDESNQEDIDFMKNIIKPHRYIIDKQKNFEKHPYTFINADVNPLDYKNDEKRLNWNKVHPNDEKKYFEKPSESNGYKFDKDLEVVKIDYYSHFPYNSLCMFYSIHQVHMLAMSYKQEHDISYDFVIRLRSDWIPFYSINLSLLDKNKISIIDANPHPGEFGKYSVNDHIGIGNEKNMTIYTDLFVYLPVYYFIFKLDWINEILLGFHLQYNNINLDKLPRHFKLLRYPERESDIIKMPTK